MLIQKNIYEHICGILRQLRQNKINYTYLFSSLDVNIHPGM